MTQTNGPEYSRAFRRLCHVAALTRDRRPREAIDRLILTVLSIDEAVTAEPGGLTRAIGAYFGISLSRGQIGESLARLTAARHLVPGPHGKMTVSPVDRADVEARGAAAAALELQVRAEWFEDLRAILGLEIPEAALWGALQTFLAATFREHGAETAALLASPGGGRLDLQTLEAHIREASESVQLGDRTGLFRRSLELFFNRQTEARTRYLAQLLDSTFTFYALSVDDATAQLLRGSLPPLSLFLDSNFIFGLLDIGDTSVTEVSQELLAGIRSGQLQFKLYYHERTLSELEKTVFAIGQRLRGRRWTSALSRAAITAGNLSSIELRYHTLNAATPIDPGVFLSRYEGLPTTLEALGIQIYRHEEDAGGSESRWQLAAEFDALVKQWRPDRLRRYEALDHDAALWLTVSGLRHGERSTLASGAVILTADLLLHRFDRLLARRSRISPSTVLPAQLLQLIRPFLPVTPDFDRRFVEAFAIPEFRSLVGNYADTASKVLSYLATYKDVPEATAVKLLRDEILLRTVATTDEGSEEFRNAVDSALVAANSQLVTTNASLVADLAAERERHASEVADLRARISAGESEMSKLKVTAETALGLAAARDASPGPARVRDRGSVGVDVRVPAAATAFVLLAIAVLMAYATRWLADPVALAKLDEPWGSLARVTCGGLGAACLTLGVLVAFWGVLRGQADFLSKSATHSALLVVAGAALIGVLGVLFGVSL